MSTSPSLDKKLMQLPPLHSLNPALEMFCRLSMLTGGNRPSNSEIKCDSPPCWATKKYICGYSALPSKFTCQPYEELQIQQAPVGLHDRHSQLQLPLGLRKDIGTSKIRFSRYLDCLGLTHRPQTCLLGSMVGQ